MKTLLKKLFRGGRCGLKAEVSSKLNFKHPLKQVLKIEQKWAKTTENSRKFFGFDSWEECRHRECYGAPKNNPKHSVLGCFLPFFERWFIFKCCSNPSS